MLGSKLGNYTAALICFCDFVSYSGRDVNVSGGPTVFTLTSFSICHSTSYISIQRTSLRYWQYHQIYYKNK